LRLPAIFCFILHPSSFILSAMEIDPGMQAAIDEMKKGLEEGGIPIGSSLVLDGKVVAAGHNKRVQDGDPITHAEIDCLRNAGRLGAAALHRATLYSTLMPCYLCSGAAVQFGIKKVVVAESRNFPGAPEFMRSHGIEVIDLDLPECADIMARFVVERPDLWNEDIGV
jgi:creatinine deaminase